MGAGRRLLLRAILPEGHANGVGLMTPNGIARVRPTPLVTGASSGIVAALAEVFAQHA